MTNNDVTYTKVFDDKNERNEMGKNVCAIKKIKGGKWI